MNSMSSALVFLCTLIAVNANPQSGFGSVQQYAMGMAQAKLMESQNCVLETYHENVDEILALRDEIMELANSSKPIMESIGQPGFDIEKYRENCISSNNELLKAIDFLKTKFSKCFEEDVLKIADEVIEFVKESRDFSCNLSEEQLSYFSKENSEKIVNCLKPKTDDLKECVKNSISLEDMNGSDSNEIDLGNAFCKIKWNQLHECGKNVIADCEPLATNALNLIGDFIFGYIDRHAKCGNKIEPAVEQI